MLDDWEEVITIETEIHLSLLDRIKLLPFGWLAVTSFVMLDCKPQDYEVESRTALIGLPWVLPAQWMHNIYWRIKRSIMRSSGYSVSEEEGEDDGHAAMQAS